MRRRSEKMTQLMKLWNSHQPTQSECEICGHLPDWRGLHRHHKEKRMFGDYSRENCQFVCFACHDKIHNGKRE